MVEREAESGADWPSRMRCGRLADWLAFGASCKGGGLPCSSLREASRDVGDVTEPDLLCAMPSPFRESAVP